MALKVEFQARASNEGEDYRQTCVKQLRDYGHTIVDTKCRFSESGIEIDILTINPFELEIFWECKGGKEVGAKVGGMKSSDNVKKAIGSACSLSCAQDSVDNPFIILTTYMMETNSPLFKQLACIPTWIIADVINDRDARRLKWWATMDCLTFERYKRDYPRLQEVLLRNPFWRLKS